MQRRVEGGGITTTDEFVAHEAGCASVTHPGLTCDEAREAWRHGKLPRTGSRAFRPGIIRKAESGDRTG